MVPVTLITGHFSVHVYYTSILSTHRLVHGWVPGHGVAVHGVPGPVADVSRHLAHPHHRHSGVEVSQHHHNHSQSLTDLCSLICS